MGGVGLAAFLLVVLCASGLVAVGLLVYVWIHRDEPLKMAAHVCMVGAGLEVTVAILLLALMPDETPDDVRRVVGLVSLGLFVEAAVFVGLAVGILNESRVCSGAAFGLYLIGTFVAFKGLAGAYLGGLLVVFIRGTITSILGWAFWDTIKTAELDAIAAQRRSAPATAGRASYLSPARPPVTDAVGVPPAPVATGDLPRSGPASGRLISKSSERLTAAEGPAPAGPGCVPCGRAFPAARGRCPGCGGPITG